MIYTIQPQRPMIPLAAEVLPTHYQTFLKTYPTYACMIMPQLGEWRWRMTADDAGIVAEASEGATESVRFDAWPIRVGDADAFFIAPSRESTYKAIGPGQLFDGELTGEEAGLCITAMALNNIAFNEEDNDELLEAWRTLMDAIYEHPGAQKMIRVLD